MKHTTPILALSILTAGSALAQTAPVKASTLNYDRVSVGYSQGDTTSGLGIGFTTLLGSNLLLGANHSDLDGRNGLDGISGKGNSLGIGTKFTAGPGDIILSYTYSQLQLSGVDAGLGLAAGLTGDSDQFSLAYRVALNSNVELSLNVAHISGDAAYAVVDGNYGAEYGIGEIALADTVDFSDTTYTVGLRFNLTKQFDVSVGYTFANENTWNVSAGLSF